MGSWLTALIVREDEDPGPLGVPCVRLRQGLSLIPVVRAGEEEQVASTLDGRFAYLSAETERLAERLSETRVVAYVETETFGGPGLQAAVVWRRSEVVVGPLFTRDPEEVEEEGYEPVPRDRGAVNCVLRHMGVSASGYHDEYAAAGLDTFRTTEDWARAATG